MVISLGLETARKEIEERTRRMEQKYKRGVIDPRIFSSGILGETENMAFKYTMTGNTKASCYGTLFNVPAGKTYTIKQIQAKIYNESLGDWRYGIYKRVNGIGSAVLVAYTEEKTTIVYGSVVAADIVWPSSSVELTEGNYALAVICGHSIGIYFGAKTGQTIWYNTYDAYSDGFSNPYGTGGTSNSSYSFYIFAEYTSVEVEQ